MIIRKRPFTLLEMMIAIFIITVCALPIITSYGNMNKVLYEDIRVNKRENAAHLIHNQMIESLYKQRIRWSDIGKDKRENAEGLEGADKEKISALLKEINYAGFYQLSLFRAKKEKGKARAHYLLQLRIFMQDNNKPDEEPVPYTYYIYAQRDLANNEKVEKVDKDQRDEDEEELGELEEEEQEEVIDANQKS